MESKSTIAPCAACKHRRQKCQPDCIFRPYFPGDQPRVVFENATRVFTAGRIRKILQATPPEQRADAARAIIYESSVRAQSPVHGSYGVVLDLEKRIKLLSDQLLQYQTGAGKPESRSLPPPPPSASTIHITLNNNNNNHYYSGVDGGVPFGIPNAIGNADANANAFVNFENGNAICVGNQAFSDGVSTGPNSDDVEITYDDICFGNDNTTAHLLSFLTKFGYKVESAAKSSTKDADDDEDPFIY